MLIARRAEPRPWPGFSRNRIRDKIAYLAGPYGLGCPKKSKMAEHTVLAYAEAGEIGRLGSVLPAGAAIVPDSTAAPGLINGARRQPSGTMGRRPAFASMPRYYFDIESGQPHQDELGEEFYE